ncbi:MAG: DUF393 domain-containing protein [Gammaproteobacteria bacterium]|nr:DUF393 domain-containing protein [Gammaproteobacteria bacterium]
MSSNPVSEQGDSTTTADAQRQPWRPLVLFDGACPLCRREIAHYRRRSGADRLNWVDLSHQARGEPVAGIDWHAAMARFHVRDADGEWQRGAFAFVELWSHLRGYRVLARLVRGLRLTGLLDRAYAVFARHRLTARCNNTNCAPVKRPTRRLGRVTS